MYLKVCVCVCVCVCVFVCVCVCVFVRGAGGLERQEANKSTLLLSIEGAPQKWVQMQEFYSLLFLDFQKVHLQDTSGES